MATQISNGTLTDPHQHYYDTGNSLVSTDTNYTITNTTTPITISPSTITSSALSGWGLADNNWYGESLRVGGIIQFEIGDKYNWFGKLCLTAVNKIFRLFEVSKKKEIQGRVIKRIKANGAKVLEDVEALEEVANTSSAQIHKYSVFIQKSTKDLWWSTPVGYQKHGRVRLDRKGDIKKVILDVEDVSQLASLLPVWG
jgi:hypothetical protein